MIQFLGDIYLDKEYNCQFDLSDFIFNLEFPISKRGNPTKNKINLRQSRSFIFETFKRFPLAVCLSNNHIMDYGESAFYDTIDFLKSNNIGFFGAGKLSNNYNNPFRTNIYHNTFDIFGYCCETTSAIFGSNSSTGCAKLSIDKISEDLCSSNADFKVVHLHWGMEDIPFPRFDDTILAHQIINSGADLIIGHHSHVIQSREVYQGKMIYYGIGNSIFPNFKLPSYYDGDKFTRVSEKYQSRKNRQSLVIEVDHNCISQEKKIFFDDKGITSMNFKLPEFIPTSNHSFRSGLRKHRKRLMINKFIENPRIPNLDHLRRFFLPTNK